MTALGLTSTPLNGMWFKNPGCDFVCPDHHGSWINKTFLLVSYARVSAISCVVPSLPTLIDMKFKAVDGGKGARMETFIAFLLTD